MIAEKSSECGFKEDLDRKEFEYLDEIEYLQKCIDDISNVKNLTEDHIQEIQQHSMENKKNKMILAFKTERLDDLNH